MDYNKALLNAKIWDLYMNNNKALIKVGYSVEVSGYDGNKVVWQVIYNHVVE